MSEKVQPYMAGGNDSTNVPVAGKDHPDAKDVSYIKYNLAILDT
jgi:hypothetical protein